MTTSKKSSTAASSQHGLTVRPGRPDDAAAACATICFEAFGGVNARHGFPSDFPDRAPVDAMMAFVFRQPFVDSVVGEQGGRIVGCNFLWRGDAVGGSPARGCCCRAATAKRSAGAWNGGCGWSSR
jgi:hypothetical protein